MHERSVQGGGEKGGERGIGIHLHGGDAVRAKCNRNTVGRAYGVSIDSQTFFCDG